jgi:hypothetical protein
MWLQVLARLPYDAAIKAKRGGGIACVCWASRDASEILTGHDDGAVLCWAVTPSGHTRLQAAYSAVAPGTTPHEGDACHPVASVDMILGATPCIVVRGGNAAELPQSLALIHVSAGSERDKDGGRLQRGVTAVPWFGTVQGVGLVRSPGSFGIDVAPTAVVTLTEGGYLCIFDVSAEAPEPFAPDFQGRPVETVVLSQVR